VVTLPSVVVVVGTNAFATKDLTSTPTLIPCFFKLVAIWPARAVLLEAAVEIADVFAVTSVPTL